MTVKDVLFVPMLKKNLISVSTIEDRGFELLFWDGKVLIHPRGSSETTTLVIGVRCCKLYKLDFQPRHALAHSSSSRSDLCELWHKRIAHLHHPTFWLLRDMVTGLLEFSTKHHDVLLENTSRQHFPTMTPEQQGFLTWFIMIYVGLCLQPL